MSSLVTIIYVTSLFI